MADGKIDGGVTYLQGKADGCVTYLQGKADGGVTYLQGKADGGVHGFLGEANRQVSVESRVVQSTVGCHLELVRFGPEGDDEGAQPADLKLHAGLWGIVLATRQRRGV